MSLDDVYLHSRFIKFSISNILINAARIEKFSLAFNVSFELEDAFGRYINIIFVLIIRKCLYIIDSFDFKNKIRWDVHSEA
jgi:hypothetical protein